MDKSKIAEKMWDLANFITGFAAARNLAFTFGLASKGDFNQSIKGPITHLVAGAGTVLFGCLYVTAVLWCRWQALTRETILCFTQPLSTNTAITTSNFFAEFAGMFKIILPSPVRAFTGWDAINFAYTECIVFQTVVLNFQWEPNSTSPKSNRPHLIAHFYHWVPVHRLFSQRRREPANEKTGSLYRNVIEWQGLFIITGICYGMATK